MKLTGSEILNKINRAQEVGFMQFPRPYLGMSSMGDQCVRKTWFSWRWVRPERFTPRILRLFDRGNREEECFVNMLRLIGFSVTEINPATKKQFEFISSKGHCKGHCDGKVHYLGDDFCAEFKTHSKTSFQQVKKINDIKISKPVHYYQCQRYMHEMGVDYTLYGAVCKDNDALHWEVFKKDKVAIAWLLDREDFLINTKTPPDKISERSGFYVCSMCNYSAICHKNIRSLANCRTCCKSTLEDNGVWRCLVRKKFPHLTLNEQLRGCQQHQYISGL
jgi:hypothetical protein